MGFFGIVKKYFCVAVLLMLIPIGTSEGFSFEILSADLDGQGDYIDVLPEQYVDLLIDCDLQYDESTERDKYFFFGCELGDWYGCEGNYVRSFSCPWGRYMMIAPEIPGEYQLMATYGVWESREEFKAEGIDCRTFLATSPKEQIGTVRVLEPEETPEPTPTPVRSLEPVLVNGDELYEWYYDDEFSYKIIYPGYWEVFPAKKEMLGEGMLSLVVFASEESEVALVVGVFSEYDMEELKAMDGKDVVINGREGYDVTFESPWERVQSKRIVVFTVEDRYYVIEATALPALFDEYANVLGKMVNSFVTEYPAPISGPSPSPTVSPSPTPSPSLVPGFGAVFAIAGLLAVAYLLRRRG
jgi:PGF-CTERM protein